MWFPTANKLEIAIKNLMTRMGNVHLATEEMLQDSKTFDAVLGPSLELQQLHAGGEKIMEALLNLLTGLRIGGASVGQVNARMSNATAMVQRHEDLFRMLRLARDAGAVEVDRFFESKNAEN